MEVEIILTLIFDGLSIVLNAFLITLIWSRTKVNIGRYRWLLMFFSAMEIFSSITDLLVFPKNHVVESGFIIFSHHGFLKGSRTIELIGVYAYFITYALILQTLVLHFVYRYCSLCRKNTVDKNLILFLMTVFTLVLVTYSLFVTLALPSERTDKFLEPSLRCEYNLDVRQTGYIGLLYYYRDINGDIVMMWRRVFSGIIALIYVSMTLTVVTVSGYAVSRGLKLKNMSQRARNLQKQLFKALIIQFTIPFITTYIPTGALFFVPFMNIKTARFFSNARYFLMITPIVDPIVTLVFIKDYRMTIIRLFGKKGSKVVNVESIHSRSANRTGPEGTKLPKSRVFRSITNNQMPTKIQPSIAFATNQYL